MSDDAQGTCIKLLSADVRLCEGVVGMWRYHLCPADDDTGTKSLCGKQTMSCNSPVESWGFKPKHMPSSYCADCERIAIARFEKLFGVAK
jgi:hypothetical protein